MHRFGYFTKIIDKRTRHVLRPALSSLLQHRKQRQHQQHQRQIAHLLVPRRPGRECVAERLGTDSPTARSRLHLHAPSIHLARWAGHRPGLESHL